MEHSWMKEFTEMYFSGQRENAYRFKHLQIPEKLYKYQSLSERNINSLKNNQIWFAKPKNLNDPFDCNALYYNEETLLTQVEFKNRIDKSKAIKDSLHFLQNTVKVTCFSEDPFNMPMWAHYGDNHRGICVEYDFTKIGFESELTRGLYPVSYEEVKYDATNLLSLALKGEPHPKLSLLYFLMLLKHKSWSYEKEWRIMLHDNSSNGVLENIPIKPSAIYFGLNSSPEKIVYAKSHFDKDIRLIELKINNIEYFSLDYK